MPINPLDDLSATIPISKVAEIEPAIPSVLNRPNAVALLSLFEKVPTRPVRQIVEITYVGKL